MLFERKDLPELHFLKHRLDDESNFVNYEEKILDTTLSPYMYNNDTMNNIVSFVPIQSIIDTTGLFNINLFSLDVEGAAPGDDFAVGSVDAVVTHIAHAAQHHAQGEGFRALGVAGADLAQQRDQRVTHQRINFVQKDDQWLVAG